MSIDRRPPPHETKSRVVGVCVVSAITMRKEGEGDNKNDAVDAEVIWGKGVGQRLVRPNLGAKHVLSLPSASVP
jgi:hypothetical protein